jgi:hypothetical protein
MKGIQQMTSDIPPIIIKTDDGTEALRVDPSGNVTLAANLTTSGNITGNSIAIVDSNNNQTISLSGDSIFVAGEITVKQTTHLGILLVNNIDATSATVRGDLTVFGALHKGGGGFKIDHPCDPTNKYLSHSFVESSEMKNIYDGVVVLDAYGEAVVQLPLWFEVLNREFRYQLTPIGAPGPNLYIAEEIKNQQFKIAGGAPNMKVCWLVTGNRKDPWAQTNQLVVEQEKSVAEREHYLHPEAYGHSLEKSIAQVPHPGVLDHFEEEQLNIAEAG